MIQITKAILKLFFKCLKRDKTGQFLCNFVLQNGEKCGKKFDTAKELKNHKDSQNPPHKKPTKPADSSDDYTSTTSEEGELDTSLDVEMVPKASTYGTRAKSNDKIINKRVEVRLEVRGVGFLWYCGTVTKVRSQKKFQELHVEFDDGDKMWIGNKDFKRDCFHTFPSTEPIPDITPDGS